MWNGNRNPMAKRSLIRSANVECLRVWFVLAISNDCYLFAICLNFVNEIISNFNQKHTQKTLLLYYILWISIAGLIRNDWMDSRVDRGQLCLLVRLSIWTRLLSIIKYNNKKCVICFVMRTYRESRKLKFDRTLDMEIGSNWWRLTFWHIIENWENYCRKFENGFRLQMCALFETRSVRVNRVWNNFHFLFIFFPSAVPFFSPEREACNFVVVSLFLFFSFVDIKSKIGTATITQQLTFQLDNL